MKEVRAKVKDQPFSETLKSRLDILLCDRQGQLQIKIEGPLRQVAISGKGHIEAAADGGGRTNKNDNKWGQNTSTTLVGCELLLIDLIAAC